MQLVISFFVFIYLAYWGSFIHLIIRKKKISTSLYFSLLLLILSSLIPDTINGYNFIFDIHSNMPHRTYYGIFPLLVYDIYVRNKVITKKHIVLISLIVLHMVYTSYTIISNSFNPPENNVPGFMSLGIVVGLAIYHFYKLFKELDIPNLLQSSLFWISSALLFYGAGTLVMVLFEPLIVSKALYFALWPVHQFVLIGYILLINKAIQVAAKYSLPLKESVN